MAKQIRRKDIIELDPFKNLSKSAKDAKTNVDLLEKSLTIVKETAKTIQKGVAGTKPKDVKSMKDFNQLTQQANQVARAKLNIDKKLREEKLKLQKLTKEQNAALKDELILKDKMAGTEEKLLAKNRQLRNERKKLNLSTKQGAKRLQQINQQLDFNNRIIERNSDKMKRQRMAIGRYKTALSGLRSGLAQLGLAFGAFTLIRDSFNVIKDFEQAQANLASVLDTNVKGMARLTKQAKDLGASTTFTAAQVSELQLELAKLGFERSQIIDMTESTLQLAEATGTELGRAAEVTGATLRGFGLSASDTQMVVDTMAKSFSSSSLDMEKFATAMASVAPVAKNAGLDIKQTTALIGTLTDRGIDASTAGTGLRNMFLSANQAGLTLDEALAQINGSADKTAASFDLFGKRGATLGVILAENTTSVAELEGKLNDSDEAAKRMADTQRDTLGGSLALLRSAWEGFILSMDEAGGIGEKLRDLIQGLANNLDTIVMVVGKVVKAFLIFKATMVGLKMAAKIKEFRQFKKHVKELGDAAPKATKGVKAFGAALKGIGLAVAITLLVELVQAIWDYASGAAAARRQQELFNQAAARGAEILGSLRDKLNAGFQETINKINEERSLRNISELEAIKQKQEAIKQQRQIIKGKIDELRLIYQKIDAQKQEIIAEREAMSLLDRTGTGAIRYEMLSEAIRKHNAEQRKARTVIDGLREDYKNLDQNLVDTNIEVNEFNSNQKETAKSTKKANDELKTEINLLKELTDNLRNLDDIQRDLRQVNRGEEIRQTERMIELKKEEALAGISETGEVNLDDVEALIQKKAQIELNAESDASAARIQVLKEEHAERFATMKENLEQEKEELLKQENLTAAQRKKIEEDYQEELKKIKMIEMDAEQNLNAAIELEEKETANKKLEIVQNMEDEITDLQQEGEDKRAEYQEKKQKELEEKRKEQLQREQDIIDALTDYALKKADERIAAIDKEIQAHQDMADFLKEAAAQGNITAKESLAEENRLIAEAEREKAEIEKRKQQIQMVSAILTAYNSNLQQGMDSGQAFTKAITDTTVLTTFLAALPGFFDGTEDTGNAGFARDEHGVITGYTHANERVLTAKQNRQIGEYSNQEVADIMERHRLGKTVDGAQIAVGFGSELLVEELMNVGSKLDQVNRTIENKPVPNVELGKVTSKTMEIIETMQKGKIRTVRTFKVNGK